MKTQESNKLIAEFMGWTEQTDPTERYFGQWFDANGVRHDRLFFDTSWDWLIPVVEKIGDTTGYELVISWNYSYWNKYGETAMGKEFEGYGGGVSTVFQAVTEFIQWYNEKK